MNYEVGLKSVLFDHKVLFNIDVFRMLISDLQQSSLSPGGTKFIVQNAGRIGDTGVELNSNFNPIEHLTLTGNLSYIDSNFDSYPNGPCVSGYPYAGAPVPAGSPPQNTSGPYKGACNLTDFTPNNAPRFEWAAGAAWRQPWLHSSMDWFARVNIHGVSGQYLNPTLDPRSYQPSYFLTDANLGIDSHGGRWRRTLFPVRAPGPQEHLPWQDGDPRLHDRG